MPVPTPEAEALAVDVLAALQAAAAERSGALLARPLLAAAIERVTREYLVFAGRGDSIVDQRPLPMAVQYLIRASSEYSSDTEPGMIAWAGHKSQEEAESTSTGTRDLRTPLGQASWLLTHVWLEHPEILAMRSGVKS